MVDNIPRSIIFGGNGFIGSHLAEALLYESHEVVIFDHFKRGMTNIGHLNSSVEIIRGDFTNSKDVAKALHDIDYVFHYVSSTTPTTAIVNPIYDIESNVIPTVKLLEVAADSGVKKIIFASSGGTVYGDPEILPVNESFPLNPQTPYAISKVAIERYLNYFYRNYGLDHLIVRYSNPYGERQNPYGTQGVIPIFLNMVKRGESPVIYGDGNSVRDYIYIDDAIDATLLLLINNKPEKIFNVGSGIGTSINELIAIISTITRHSISPKYVPDNKGYIQKIVLDVSKIKRTVDWMPKVSLNDGVRLTWSYINNFY